MQRLVARFYLVEELGHAEIARAVSPVGVATGETCANRVIFKQLLQAEAIDVVLEGDEVDDDLVDARGRHQAVEERRALRRLDRHVLARQREVGRLRRGLRLLRPVALRRVRHPDARDDGARADPRARARGRGGAQKGM